MNNITPFEGVEDSHVRYSSISKSPVPDPFVCQHFETTVPILYRDEVCSNDPGRITKMVATLIYS